MGKEVNKRGEGPRYEPSYGDTLNDEFVGYAGELDLWYDSFATNVSVVGPEHRKARPDSMHNFDVYNISGDNLTFYEGDTKDLHIDVHDMCLIYALCVEHGVFGLFKENKNG